jgi:alanine dehydrogenase
MVDSLPARRRGWEKGETKARSSLAVPLWIREQEVVELLDLDEALGALEAALRLEAAGEACDLAKTHVGWDGGTLHALGAALPGEGLAGTKTWTHTPRGATPLLLLFDSRDGRLLAVIEAFALGQLRTAAASGLATSYLADPDARELALVGTGRQAVPQAAAVVAVRPIRRVRLFGRDAARRAACAAELRRRFAVEVVEYGDITSAVAGAPIVTLATRATEPFLRSAMLAPGAHINAIGAIGPTGAEMTAELVAGAERLVVDSVAQARRLSREFREALGPDETAWGRVEPLAAVVAGGRRRDPSGRGWTVFKSFGMGLSDLAVGSEVYRRAVRAGVGRAIPDPERVAPRLAVAAVASPEPVEAERSRPEARGTSG